MQDSLSTAIKRFTIRPGAKIRLDDFDPGDTAGLKRKELDVDALLQTSVAEIAHYQDILFKSSSINSNPSTCNIPK
jgi:hypothetical protein